MRLPLIVAALILSAPAASAGPADESPNERATIPAIEQAGLEPGKACRKTATHYAGSGSAWKGDGLQPKKLNELPPAVGYMAVVRVIDGCEVPLTVVEYRKSPGPPLP
jgi:hypothetical protein